MKLHSKQQNSHLRIRKSIVIEKRKDRNIYLFLANCEVVLSGLGGAARHRPHIPSSTELNILATPKMGKRCHSAGAGALSVVVATDNVKCSDGFDTIARIMN
jgi:hypothetical protein